MTETKPASCLLVVALVALMVLPPAGQAALTPVFTDNFDGYALGALDKNLLAGPNAAPNGSGNPWFGPWPPNAQVIPAEDLGGGNIIDPHSGNQMIRGRYVTGADFDQNWYNLAYRLNGGQPYTGNIELDWYFYDAGEPGDTNFRDYAALCYYDTAPGDTDYPGTGNLNSGATQVQRLSLGAPYDSSIGYNSNYYQARIVGATDGYSGTGYFNTTVLRSAGWHYGQIVVGPALADNTNDVTFYIDGALAFAHNSVTAWGYNIIEINTKFGSHTGYFDDVRFLAAAAGRPADFDSDGDVDLIDFGHFQSCFNGPNRPPAAGDCADADFDDDNDVDLIDFGTFQGCFNGPNRPPAC